MDALIIRYGHGMLLFVVVCAVGLVAVTWVPVRAESLHRTLGRRLLWLSLALAVVATCGDAVMTERFGRGSWATPGQDLGALGQMLVSPGSLAAVLLLLNLLLFLPAGFFGGVSALGLAKVVAVVLTTSVSIEVLQFGLLAGVASLDDVVLNGLGGAVGAAVGDHVRSRHSQDVSQRGTPAPEIEGRRCR